MTLRDRRRYSPAFHVALLLTMSCFHTAVFGFVMRTATVSSRTRSKTTQRPMVRNIDLPEALLFYGKEILFQEDGTPQDGVLQLLEECRQVETAAILIADMENTADLPNGMQDLVVYNTADKTSKPPNPRYLWEAIHSVEIQPRGFGGSSGFGRKQADQFKRNPLPQHVVVFCKDTEETRSEHVSHAARMAGMRVISFDYSDALADAVVEDGFYGMYLDDVATPGWYWLNPPHPRDKEGNRVDPVEVIEWYDEQGEKAIKGESIMGVDEESIAVEAGPAGPPLSDDEIYRILADLDPL